VTAALVPDLPLGVGDSITQQIGVLRRKPVWSLTGLTVVGESGVDAEIVADVTTTSLHKVAGQFGATCLGVELYGSQLRVKQTEHVTKRSLVAGMWRGRDQDQMGFSFLGQGLKESITLRASTTTTTAVVDHTGMGLIDDDQIGCGAQEVVTTPVRLDEIGRDDSDRVTLENRFAVFETTLQTGDRGAQDKFCFETELLTQLGLPLLGQRGRTQHCEPLSATLREELAGDQSGLNSLTDAHIVGDQESHGLLPQRHQQGDVLIGPWIDVQGRQRPEGTTRGAEPDTECLSQETG